MTDIDVRDGIYGVEFDEDVDQRQEWAVGISYGVRLEIFEVDNCHRRQLC